MKIKYSDPDIDAITYVRPDTGELPGDPEMLHVELSDYCVSIKTKGWRCDHHELRELADYVEGWLENFVGKYGEPNFYKKTEKEVPISFQVDIPPQLHELLLKAVDITGDAVDEVVEKALSFYLSLCMPKNNDIDGKTV